jgi:hypothetical protein
MQIIILVFRIQIWILNDIINNNNNNNQYISINIFKNIDIQEKKRERERKDL